jgi:hypothetical protein
MLPASLVISCASPIATDGQEVEDWLANAVTGLGPEVATLYRARPDPAPPEAERVWFVTVSDESAAASPRMATLLAEMRLLGLRPSVYRPGSLPSSDHALVRAQPARA